MPLLPIFLVVAVDILSFTIIVPLLPFYAEKYGASPQVVGLLATSFALCQLISGPILGRLSDRLGRRPLLLVSQVGSLAGLIMLAKADTLWMIFASRILDGVTAGNVSLAQAYISDVTEPQNRAKAFGLIGIAFGLGFLIGPAVSGFLSQYGYQYPAWAAAFFSLVSIVATYFLLPEVAPRATKQESKKRAWYHHVLQLDEMRRYFALPELGPRLTQFFLFSMSFSMWVWGLALFTERRFTYDGHPFGAREVGYVYAYNGLLGMIIQGGMIGRLVKKFGEGALVTMGFASIAIAYTMAGQVSVVPLLLCACTFGAFGNGVIRPALTSLITQAVPRTEQGTVLGINQSLASVAQIVAPALAGFLIDRSLLGTWATAAAGFAALGALSGIRTRRPREAALINKR